MKKVSSSADLGGGPFTKADLRVMFNQEIWDAMQSLLSPFDSDTEGIILSGCVVTANIGTPANFDITAGIVYLNGEFMRVEAVNNQTFPKYIQPLTPINDTRTFADSTTHTVAVEKKAWLDGFAPGSGQYVTIGSLTDPDDRRWSNMIVNRQVAAQFSLTVEALGGFRTAGSGPYLKRKVVQIGDWNMDSTATVSVAHGLGSSWKNIRGIKVIVRDDADSFYSDLLSQTTQSAYHKPSGYTNGFDSTNINLARVAAPDGDGHNGWFDGTGYDSTSYNRGWVLIDYEA